MSSLQSLNAMTDEKDQPKCDDTALTSTWKVLWKQLAARHWRVRHAKTSDNTRTTIYLRPGVKLGTGIENQDFFLSVRHLMAYVQSRKLHLMSLMSKTTC